MVQLYVSQLRRLLAGDDAQIVTHGRGYELRIPADAVDAARFERLVEQAGRTGAKPDGTAREALALWRGAALADVADEPFAAAEIRRLDELWLRAQELAVDGDLAAGRKTVLAELERLIEAHPLRERLHAQRMLALYRSGRQAEALDAYVAARRRLVDAPAIEPGSELRDLHDRMLRQDPSLRLPVGPSRRSGALRRGPRTAGPRLTRAACSAGAAVAVLVASPASRPLACADEDLLPGIDENSGRGDRPGRDGVTCSTRSVATRGRSPSAAGPSGWRTPATGPSRGSTASTARP